MVHPEGIVIELSRYVFQTLRQDEEFEFSRGRRDESEVPNILLVAPTSEHPVPAILGRLEHEYSLRGELDSGWAARALTLVRRDDNPVLILEGRGRRSTGSAPWATDGIKPVPSLCGRYCSCASQTPPARSYPQGYQDSQSSGGLRERRGLADWFRDCFPSSARTPVGRTTRDDCRHP